MDDPLTAKGHRPNSTCRGGGKLRKRDGYRDGGGDGDGGGEWGRNMAKPPAQHSSTSGGGGAAVPEEVPTSATDAVIFIRILKVVLHNVLPQDQHQRTDVCESFSPMAIRLPRSWAGTPCN